MKKMLTLVCSIALCMGANAQVKQARVVGEPKSQEMLKTSGSLIETASKVLGKAEEQTFDTLTMEAAFHATRLGVGFNASVNDWDVVGTTPAVFWIMGTGWINYYYGSGEIGYMFDFSPEGWYRGVGRKNYSGRYITGALAYIGRNQSTVSYINEKAMPFYFKLYTGDNVVQQMAYGDITSNQADEEAPIEVFYPTSPKKYTSYSEKIEVPIMEVDPEEKIQLGSDMFGARFTNPAVAGNYPCISFVFPHENPEEDTLWNVTLFTVMEAGTTNRVVSEREGSMYVVYDFTRQNMWSNQGQPLRSRSQGFIPEEAEAIQTDTNYAILPMIAWWWTDRNQNRSSSGRMSNEPYFRVILSDQATVERGASYDKYVEVKNNPAVGFTEIVATDKIQRVDIYDMNGKLMKSQKCNNNVETISVEGLNSGMYVAKVTTTAGIANKKLMVR